MATVGSLFSGIGGFDLGLERAGWEVRWQLENDSFCNAILERHWPGVARYGDITEINTDELEPIDLLCGGFPCQDLSVAGARAGLAGERSSLFFELARIAGALRPRWLLVENVPGLFSSSDGRDFGVVLSTLAEFGYGLAWRVLDSQYFGVAQRRRRVFIVGHLGSPCPPEILFESESLCGDTPPSREAGEGVADPITSSFAKHDWGSAGKASFPHNLIAPALRGRHDSSSRDGQDIAYALSGPHRGVGQGWNVSYALPAKAHDRGDGTDNYVIRLAQQSSNGQGVGVNEPVHALDGTGGDAIASPPPDSDGVRDAPGVPAGLDPTPDSPRYRALGNAVTVPVVEWIGRRILAAERP